MSALAVKTEAVQVMNGALAIDAYVAQPTTGGPYPGIIVIQEIFGVNAHIRSIAERLAAEGYVAIAPALYQRTAPGYATGYSPDEVTQGRHYKDQTHADELRSDIESAIRYLYQLPTVSPNGVGAIGFCFGGHVAYLVATLPDVKATASFYGAGIPTFTPGGGNPTLSHTPDIGGRLYAFFGNDDPLIPHEHIDQIAAALKTHQIDHQVFRYDGAGHGFVCDQRGDYNKEAANAAWQNVLELFKSQLSLLS